MGTGLAWQPRRSLARIVFLIRTACQADKLKGNACADGPRMLRKGFTSGKQDWPISHRELAEPYATLRGRCAKTALMIRSSIRTSKTTRGEPPHHVCFPIPA